MTKLSAGELAAFLTELAEEEGWLPHNRRKLRECAARLRAQEGWVLVPREPTEAMLKAAEDAEYLIAGGFLDGNAFGPIDIYRAMLSALPAAPGGIRLALGISAMTFRQRCLKKWSSCFLIREANHFVIQRQNIFGEFIYLASGTTRYHAWKNAWLKLTGPA